MVFPAHAGMFLAQAYIDSATYRFPRARGDVPKSKRLQIWCSMFSPRTRGCSEDLQQAMAEGVVFPAHAGMFRGY